MEIKLKENQLIIKKTLKKNQTYKISKGSKFESITIFKKPQTIKGISSFCNDGNHVLFIDYDNVPLWIVEQDFFQLQEKYSLPPAYLLCTKLKKQDKEVFGNFHVICLVKLLPYKIFEIIKQTHADRNFVSMPLRNKYRNWILRIGKKRHKDRPKFYKIIGETINLSYEISSPHLKYLEEMYEIPKIKYSNRDKSSYLFIQEYEAS